MEWLVLGAFCAGLLGCIALDLSILYALGFGLLLFLLYGRRKGVSWRELWRSVLRGIRTVSNILVTFLLIGILTALWRAAGTIPVIVCYASALIRPSIFLLMTFLLNCGVSVLTGTSFGTAATMGVICAAMGAAMGVDPVLTGGAVLSGVFFGDRCSPVSTSALLVSAVTGTDIYGNIKRMIRTAIVPFLLSCAAYGLMGLSVHQAGGGIDLYALFGKAFRLHWLALAPAVVILVLSALRVNVKLSMAASILVSVPICLLLQNIPISELMRSVVAGFTPKEAEVAAMVSGGGIVSMLKVTGIVCLSSSYAGLFEKTGLLDGARSAVRRVSEKTTPFAATTLAAAVTGMIACNQTLTILLTDQLCRESNPDAQAFAIDLEDTAVVIAPLVPWSIAGGVPLASIGAPTAAILAACYLYLLPLWRLLGSFRGRGKARGRKTHR